MAEPRAGYRRLEGSERVPLPGATRLGPADPAERVSVCICLRRRPGAPPLGDSSRPPARVTHEEFGALYGADPAEIAQVEAFAAGHGLTVEGSSIPRRTVDLSGTVAQLSEAFGVDLGRYAAGETSYRGREGHVYLPEPLVPLVKGVFGLDNRPVGRSHARAAASARGTAPLTPAALAQLYRFPAGINAAGQCIGLLQFGGGYHPEDITEWFKEQQLTPPELVDVSVQGAANAPRPWVTGVSPASGPAAGGTAVTITGAALDGAYLVSFGGASAAISPGGTATQITVTSPPGAGQAWITVSTPSGTASFTPASRFTYTAEATLPVAGPGPQVTGISPPSGSAAGGNLVTITGTGLITPDGPTTVTFGGTKATVSPNETATELTVTSPPGIGLAQVVVTTPAGTSAAGDIRTFSYTLAEITEPVLDIDVAGAVAQGARIAVYFAPANELGWVTAVSTAIQDTVNKPSVLSISWGHPELAVVSGISWVWTQDAINSVSAALQDAAPLGITVLASTGDAGSDCLVGDKTAHVEYPASDPGVTSCGGTEIQDADPAGGSFRELLWLDRDDKGSVVGGSGGGVSAYFPIPSWQASTSVPASLTTGVIRRGVPDVAGNASPYSGYVLRQNGGKIGPIGGTSAVAPLYAGLVALLNANLNEQVGYLNPGLYGLANAGVFRDVTEPVGQTNGCNGAPGYPVGPGWDAATGLGSVIGTALLNNVAQLTRPILWLASTAGPGGDVAASTVAVTSGGWTGNGVTWAAGGPTPQQSPATPSLAMFGGRVYMAFSAGADPGNGSSVLVCSTDKRMNWTASTTIGSNAWAPALAVFRGRLYAAFVTQGSDKVFDIAMTSTADGVHWTEPAILPFHGAPQPDPLSLAVFNGQLYLAFLSSPWGVGVGHFNVGVYATADLQNWNYVLNVDLNSMFTPSLAVFNGNLYVALSGNDANLPGILTFRSADGKNWTRGQNFFGQGVQNGVSLAAVGERLLAAFIPQNSGNAVSLCSTADGQTWTASTSTGFTSSVLPALAATTIETGETAR